MLFQLSTWTASWISRPLLCTPVMQSITQSCLLALPNQSEDQSKLAARKYARVIQKLGFEAKFKDFKIQNIVGSCDVKFSIRLEALHACHGAFSTYEPEIFPGLIYRMKQPKIVLLVVVSGNIVLTGAKLREETYTAFENIYPVLTMFRKTPQWWTGSIWLSE